MVYLVKLTARAERDLEYLYDQINAEGSQAASQWYWKMKDAILSLAEHPNRRAMTRENRRLRHLLYGSKPHVYRVIFQKSERSKEVTVLHIRHGARRRFNA